MDEQQFQPGQRVTFLHRSPKKHGKPTPQAGVVKSVGRKSGRVYVVPDGRQHPQACRPQELAAEDSGSRQGQEAVKRTADGPLPLPSGAACSASPTAPGQ